MNKGFTIAVLGVVLCAMGLIFFLHTGGEQPPAQVAGTSSDTPAGMTGNGTKVFPGGNATTASGPVTGRASDPLPRVDPPVSSGTPVRPGSSNPDRATEPAKVEPPKVTPAKVEPAKVEPPKTEPAKAEGPKPGTAAVEPAKTEPAKVEPPKAEPPKNETPKTEPPKTEGPKAESPKTDPPKAEAPKTEPAKAGAPVREEDLSPTASHALRAIELRFADRKMLLRVEADGPFPVKTFALSEPDRLVIDLPGKWKDMKAPTVPANKVVKNVRLGAQPTGPRLVLDLHGPLKNRSVHRISPSIVEIIVE